MKKAIEETTRLLLQGNLTKDEADKILLGLLTQCYKPKGTVSNFRLEKRESPNK